MKEEKRDNFSRDRSDNERKSPSGEMGTTWPGAWRVRSVTLSAVESALLWPPGSGVTYHGDIPDPLQGPGSAFLMLPMLTPSLTGFVVSPIQSLLGSLS